MVASPARRPAPGRYGLAETDAASLGREVMAAWTDFLAVVEHPATDLSRPSRLRGWTGRDLLVHLGSWPDAEVMTGVLASAAEGGAGTSLDPDASNAALLAAHTRATTTEVVQAVREARDRVGAFFASPDADSTGRLLSRSTVGPLPVFSLIHAGCFELAVHALDLAGCGAPAPSEHLLDRGLAALLDVTGALAARQGVHLTLTAQTPTGGWSFSSGDDGWTTDHHGPGRVDGVGVRGSAVDLLETASGRTNLPQLLLSRRLVVQQLPQWMRLAPLLDDVPGLPGGATLKTAVSGLSGIAGGVSGLGRALGRLRR